MQQLIEVIGAAIATDATSEQKASGAQACRTILTALDAEPGQPLVLPGMPRPHVLTGVSIDQVLDLVIARLSVIASDQDRVALPQTVSAPSPSVVTSVGNETQPNQPRGLRVPIATNGTLKTAPRPTSNRASPRTAPRTAQTPAPQRKP